MAEHPKKLLAVHVLLDEAGDCLNQLASGTSRPPNGIVVEWRSLEAAYRTFTALCGALEDLDDGDVLGDMGRNLMHVAENTFNAGVGVGNYQLAVSSLVVRFAIPSHLRRIREQFNKFAGPSLLDTVSVHQRISATVNVHLQQACSELLERNTTGVMPSGVIRDIATRIGGGQKGMSEEALAIVERYVVTAALAHAAGKPKPVAASSPDEVTGEAEQEPAAPGM